MKSRRRAFTLMELLVVLTVLAALGAMAYPVFQRVTAGGRATACISNLRQLGLTLNLYTSDNDTTMPTLRAGRALLSEDVPVIDNTLDRYTTNRAIFTCPADNRHLAATSGTSYYWNVALNGQSLNSLNFLNLVTDNSRIPILSDKEGFHPYSRDKVNILYADGHTAKELRFFTPAP